MKKHVRVLGVLVAVIAAIGVGTVPASAEVTGNLYASSGFVDVGNGWGQAEYGHTSSLAYASKSGFRLAVRGHWREFGQTGLTAWKWNIAVYGGYVSVNAYVCDYVNLKY